MNATINTDASNARIAPMIITAHTIVKSVWIIFTIHLTPLMEHRKENMTVRVWQMFIRANILADMLPKLSMPLNSSKIYPI